MASYSLGSSLTSSASKFRVLWTNFRRKRLSLSRVRRKSLVTITFRTNLHFRPVRWDPCPPCWGARPRCRAWIYPPAIFSPDPAENSPPVYDSAARRGGHNNMNTMALYRGLPPIIARRGVPLTRSGGIPLSLTYTPPVRG